MNMLQTPTTDPAPGRSVVLFDGTCAFCQKSVSILKRLDWRGRLVFQEAQQKSEWPPSAVPLKLSNLLEEMHVVSPDREHTYGGFAAFRFMAWRLPVLWPVAPLFYLPGVPWIGNKAYRFIAKHRYQIVPCHDGACAVPLRPKSVSE